jgi:hypothetical protein
LGFYRWYSDAWLGYYEPPEIYQYNLYISETSLYDAAANQLVWTGTAQTKAGGDIRKDIQGYIDTVIDALKKKNLLPAR